MKRTICFILSVVMVLCTMVAVPAFADGTGTPEDPIEIYTIDDLKAVANGLEKSYILMNDIDLEGDLWVPIGHSWSAFTGTFDGNEKIIRNGKVTLNYVPRTGQTGSGFCGDTEGNGIFGHIAENAHIFDIGVEDMYLEDTSAFWGSMLGGLVGNMADNAKISNSYARNISIWSNGKSATNRAGGLVARMSGKAVVENCYAMGTSFNSDHEINYDAGLVGVFLEDTLIKNCYSDTTLAQWDGNTIAWDETSAECINGHCVNSYYVQNPPWPWAASAGQVTQGYVGTKTDMAAIASALIVDQGAYKEDVNNKNTGYPLLSWEDEGEPVFIEITNKDELEAIANNRNANYILMNDIDMEGNSLDDEISNEENAFTGIFDGNGHVIKNYVVKPELWHPKGLFGTVDGDAVVKNLGVENVTIETYTWYVSSDGRYAFLPIGGIIGEMRGNATLSGCYAKNVTVDFLYAQRIANGGALVGAITSAGNVVENCYEQGFVINEKPGDENGEIDWDGAIVGKMSAGTMRNCYADTYLTRAMPEATIENSYYGIETLPWPWATGSDGDKSTNGYYPGSWKTGAGMNLALPTADNGFAMGIAKNNGYPAFTWEMTPTYIKSIALTNGEGNAVTSVAGAANVASVTVTKADSTAEKLIVAAYSGKQMVNAKICDVSTTGTANVGLSLSGLNADTIKVFMFNDMDKITNTAEVVEVK